MFIERKKEVWLRESSGKSVLPFLAELFRDRSYLSLLLSNKLKYLPDILFGDIVW